MGHDSMYTLLIIATFIYAAFGLGRSRLEHHS
jgi:hypothetical protein